jgi:prepilin signal peptidase PulO-like enzyme (type II secretory pathway)
MPPRFLRRLLISTSALSSGEDGGRVKLMTIIYLSTFVFGLIVGSFLNCVIFRLEKGENFLKGRSHCPHCGHVLAWYDLVPVLSFIILKRRCRYCGKNISWQYPIVELATGILFIFPFFLSPLRYGIESYFGLLFYFSIISFLIIIFIYDLKHFIILDKVLFPAMVISFLYLTINSQLSIINHSLSALGAFAFFLSIYLISKGKWLGFGDVKLVILLGLLLGWPKILLSLFLSFVIGGTIGIGLIVFSKRKLKSEVPFAPFLILGALIAFFYGNTIINWYFSLIF